jgi:hypothetical protein
MAHLTEVIDDFPGVDPVAGGGGSSDESTPCPAVLERTPPLAELAAATVSIPYLGTSSNREEDQFGSTYGHKYAGPEFSRR